MSGVPEEETIGGIPDLRDVPLGLLGQADARDVLRFVLPSTSRPVERLDVAAFNSAI